MAVASSTGEISAIVPTYNRADLLRETLEALLVQTRPVSEIIVWDDGSSDHTDQMVETVAETAATPIRYFRQGNAGKSRALNAALGEARGDYVWICDDDDLARPDAAERMGRVLDADPGVIAAGAHNRFSLDKDTGARSDMGPGYWPDLAEGSVLRHTLEDVFFFQNGMLAHRSVYDRVGPYREDLARSIDYDMIARQAARFPITLLDGIVFDQRKHDGARGPAAARHAAAASEAVWLKNDQAVFEGLRAQLPLSLYAAMFDAETPELAERAGLLQRAAVHGRRDDWGPAFDDFEAAAAIAAGGPLTPVETMICRRAVSGKHGCESLFADPAASRTRALARSGPLGGAIVAGLGQGLKWRVRVAVKERRAGAAARYLSFIAFALRKGGRGSGEPPRPLIERAHLPAEAYQW